MLLLRISLTLREDCWNGCVRECLIEVHRSYHSLPPLQHDLTAGLIKLLFRPSVRLSPPPHTHTGTERGQLEAGVGGVSLISSPTSLLTFPTSLLSPTLREGCLARPREMGGGEKTFKILECMNI